MALFFGASCFHASATTRPDYWDDAETPSVSPFWQMMPVFASMESIGNLFNKLSRVRFPQSYYNFCVIHDSFPSPAHTGCFLKLSAILFSLFCGYRINLLKFLKSLKATIIHFSFWFCFLFSSLAVGHWINETWSMSDRPALWQTSSKVETVWNISTFRKLSMEQIESIDHLEYQNPLSAPNLPKL